MLAVRGDGRTERPRDRDESRDRPQYGGELRDPTREGIP